jgi:hypothetical protein
VQLFEEEKTVIEDIGWIRVKLETLPSQGIFYPHGTEITIRAAMAAEIRHWSTIDEEDLLSLDDALNRIVDKCCKIRFPRQMGSFKDLKEIDRFFIVFAIREYTFKKGENNLNVSFDCKNLIIALVASGFAVKSATSSLVKNLPYLADLGSLTSYKIFSRVSRFLILLLLLMVVIVVVVVLIVVHNI